MLTNAACTVSADKLAHAFDLLRVDIMSPAGKEQLLALNGKHELR